jgi:hypothetical protein
MLLTENTSVRFPVTPRGLFSLALSGVFDGATVTLSYATGKPAAATLTLEDADENEVILLTSHNPGAAANALTIALIDPEEPSRPLSLAIDDEAIAITLATDIGDAAAITLNPTGDNNNLLITARIAGETGNDHSISLVDPSANNAPLTISTPDGLHWIASLATGAGGSITTTAAQLKTALEANPGFHSLFTVANAAGNNGSGTMTVLAEASLTGGGANAEITTTYAQLLALINREASFQIQASAIAEADLTALVAPLAATNLTGGTDGTFAPYAGSGIDGTPTGTFTAPVDLEIQNVGVSGLVQLALTDADEATSITAIIQDIPN